MNTPRLNLLNIWKENTGGKVPVLQIKPEPSLVQMTGYQPPRTNRIVTYQRGVKP